MSIKNFDRYYDPPELPEANFCEYCGEELDEDNDCQNRYCPDKFLSTTIEHEMAEIIVDLKESVEYWQRHHRQAQGHIQQLLRSNNELSGELKEAKSKLTPSQIVELADIVRRI